MGLWERRKTSNSKHRLKLCLRKSRAISRGDSSCGLWTELMKLCLNLRKHGGCRCLALGRGIPSCSLWCGCWLPPLTGIDPLPGCLALVFWMSSLVSRSLIGWQNSIIGEDQKSGLQMPFEAGTKRQRSIKIFLLK